MKKKYIRERGRALASCDVRVRAMPAWRIEGGSAGNETRGIVPDNTN